VTVSTRRGDRPGSTPEVAVVLGAPRRALARVLVTALLASVAGTVGAVAAPTAALASSASLESQFVAKMNAARQAAGLRPYAVYSDLTSVARSHSQQMASQQRLYHNPNLTSDVQNWQAVGENVGEGPTVSDIHTAFMNSPEHRANILDHDFTQVGVGVSVDKNGIIWVTEDFRQPMHSTSTTTTKTTTTHKATTTSSAPVRHATVASHPAVAPTQAPAARPTSRPAVTVTPPAVLKARLKALRTAAAAAAPADPVTQTFDFLSAVTTLTG
jgi:hypothetical protein